MKRAIVFILAVWLGGCGGGAPPTTEPTTRPLSVADTPNPQDAPAKVQFLVYLEVYQIILPAGSVSGSDEFWKHIDEQGVDIGLHDLLIKNGMRVGVGQVKEWDYFRKLLEKNPVTTKPMYFQKTADLGREELVLKDDVGEQTVFFFNKRDDLEGRTYDQSQNVMCMEYRATPRRPGEVTIRLCPMIRALRKRFVWVGESDRKELQFISPERFYDLGFEMDVPVEKFMVVAPSSEGKWRATLGHRMLIQDGTAGEQERILLIVPRLWQVVEERHEHRREPLGGGRE